MRALQLAVKRDAPLHVLFVGAHCDDIEIGCGGTILELARWHPHLTVQWVVLSGTDERAQEAQRSADRFLSGVRTRQLVVERFRDGYLPYESGRVKDYFECLRACIDPDVVFAPHRGDWHQDHRFVAEVTWSTFRDNLILEYETPKYDPEPGGAPNLLVPIDDDIAEAKVQHLLEVYASQASKSWFTRDVFLAAMRLRGIQARVRFAEAFHARKLLLSPPVTEAPPDEDTRQAR
jgi:LmbE family N-acetylglucosaminyl deacetylase